MIWLIGGIAYIGFTVTIIATMVAASNDDDLHHRDELAWISQLNIQQEVRVG